MTDTNTSQTNPEKIWIPSRWFWGTAILLIIIGIVAFILGGVGVISSFLSVTVGSLCIAIAIFGFGGIWVIGNMEYGPR